MSLVLKPHVAGLAISAFLVAFAGFPHSCRAAKVDVATVTELRVALNDTNVDHGYMLPSALGVWKLTEKTFPPGSAIIGNQSVTLGSGRPGLLYMDMNMGVHQVIIADGGNLTQINIWGDDCYFSRWPFSCFLMLEPGSCSSVQNGMVSDAGCVKLQQPLAISTALTFYCIASFLKSSFEADYIDEKTVHIKDTGWLIQPGPSHGRIVNTTFSCTANITHIVPPAREAQLPQYRIAASRGYILETALGSGHFGRVYRSRKTSSGQPVAIKIMDRLPNQRRQLADACRECQHMSRVHHECMVRVDTFYAAQVFEKKKLVEATHGMDYVELGFHTAAIVDGSLAGKATWAPFGLDTQRTLGATPPADKARDSPPFTGKDTSTSKAAEALQFTQVYLVMQYCDMGMDNALKAGTFHDPKTSRPKLRHILATALEIAQGLEYLHHPDRRMVHRDLSATNVLLMTTAVDDRGFRALLSDFGLSTSLYVDATHKTSEVKGTISYMSPEMFLEDSVSPALDVYSLGIILHLMYAGKDPYTDESPAQIILRKVRAAKRPEEKHLPDLDENCPSFYQQLVWDCTNPDRRSSGCGAAHP